MSRPRRDERQGLVLFFALGTLLVVWLALLIAPYAGDDLFAILGALSRVMEEPFHIQLCEDSFRTVLILLLIYGLTVGAYASTRRNYRRGEENGSAKWGNPKTLNKKYEAREAKENKLLTEHVRMGLDGRVHRRNLNVMLVGGAGAGKTRGYAIPNLLQGNTSFVILDPKGELLWSTGKLLEEEGYEIRVLDLIHMEKSHGYNPFHYLRDDNDVQRLVTNLFKATTPKGSTTQDPFWDNAAQMLLSALIFYLLKEAPEEEQNFEMVMELLRSADVEEDNARAMSPVDILFMELELRQPDHIALKYYKMYHRGAGKTLKSIQITLASRLEKFNLGSMASLTRYDELDLPSIGEKKVALFCIIPDNDTSFNFIVSMLYTQIFQQLFALADNKYHGALPVSVHFLMDEFANVSLPDDFDKILATMRSRGVFVSIILQNLAQLKALFEKQWESIVGNCDTMIYLGGNEQSTHEYVSKLLGKETIDTNSYGRSRGRNGQYTTNYQISGRELLTPDEVRTLDNRYALLFIRGEAAVMDTKINPLRHPNSKHTPLAGAAPYIHGELTHSAGSFSFGGVISQETVELPPVSVGNYEILSSDELIEKFKL